MKIRNKKRSINKKSFPLKVKCSCCGNYYADMYGNGQGVNCSSNFSLSESDGYYIYSHYGSGFDTMKFIIKNMNIVKKKHYLKESAICDKCISKYLNKKYLEIDQSYDPFALIAEMNSFYQEDPQRYYEIVKEGPKNCIRLIREERVKPMEQRIKEREGKPILKLTRISDNFFDDF